MASAKESKKSDLAADLLSRTPPASHEAENSVLGCIMLVNDTIDQVLDLLRPEQFYDGQNRRIFSTIVEMYEDGERGIDAVTLKERLQKKGELDAAGGVAKLLEIMETVPHAAHVEYYAKIVQEKYLQRPVDLRLQRYPERHLPFRR